MIRTFAHKGLEKFFTAGSKAGIRPEHTKRLRLILGVLHAAAVVEDMAFPGSRLHSLHGDREGQWAVSVSGNWRVVFRFITGDACDVDYLDYH